jgi:uncharacterized membrane protein
MIMIIIIIILLIYNIYNINNNYNDNNNNNNSDNNNKLYLNNSDIIKLIVKERMSNVNEYKICIE